MPGGMSSGQPARKRMVARNMLSLEPKEEVLAYFPTSTLYWILRPVKLNKFLVHV